VIRVAVTGLGAVSALGIGVPAFWEQMTAGKSGVGRITQFDPTGYLAQAAAEVPSFDPSAYFKDGERDLLDRFAPSRSRIARGLPARGAGGRRIRTRSHRRCDRKRNGRGDPQDDAYKRLYAQALRACIPPIP
jgi:3-oxoacyl-[acyl-carrier-protein] synthase II